jgi:hypothetical protein
MDIIEQTVRDSAAQLQAGANTRVVCPSCQAAHEKSFSVCRDAHAPQKIWFRCWRAACGIHGKVTDAAGIVLQATDAESDSDLAAIPILTRVPSPLQHALAEQLEMQYHDVAAQGLQYDPFTQTVYYPWYNFNTSRRIQVGWQTRPSATSKATPLPSSTRLLCESLPLT